MNLASVKKRSEENREDWIYTDLASFESVFAPSHSLTSAQTEFNFAHSSNIRLTFVNGEFYPSRSSMDGMPDNLLEGDALSGYTLSLAEETCLVTMPIELLFIGRPQKGIAEINTRLNIKFGNSCRLTLIEKHEGTGPVHIIETSIELAPRAKLVHGKVFSSASAHFSFTEVKVNEGSYYDNFSLIEDGPLTRSEIEVTLTGKHAQCSLRGAMMLRGKSHADTATRIRHCAPECISRQVYKTVVDEKAHGVFQGKIIVDEDAQKSDGYQLSRALLLSDQAEMDSKPELEINADDVKCSHGSTVGDIDEQALFYLRSRGVPEAEARAILVRAFIDELANEVSDPALREAIGSEIERWVGHAR